MDIDAPVLDELKRLGRAQHKSLGRVVSDLLGPALRDAEPSRAPATFAWIAKPMGAKVDLSDRDALYAALDEAGKP
jgi:hypothetical protein